MDPSALACALYDTLREPAPAFDESVLPPAFAGPLPPLPALALAAADTAPPDAPAFADAAAAAQLAAVKEAYAHPRFTEARSACNPFEAVGKCGFINRAAVKLANIDAVFALSAGAAAFTDVAAGPGGFTQYLQFRRPAARGYGMTLESAGPSFQWDTAALRFGPDAFTPTAGRDGTGDLLTNWDFFADFVREREPFGVDLAVADGAVDEVATNFARREGLNARLFLAQVLVAARVLRPGGSAVVKFFGAATEASAAVVLLAAHAFERVTVFKPVSSRPATEEVYLVARGRRADDAAAPAVAALEAAARFAPGQALTRIFAAADFPAPFAAWLRAQNDANTAAQLAASVPILEYLAGRPAPAPAYFLPKLPLIWKIPAGPPVVIRGF